MSDTKNHKQAIRAIIEAHRTPGKMREIMLQILCDKPSAIANAWDEVKPEVGKINEFPCMAEERVAGHRDTFKDELSQCPDCKTFVPKLGIAGACITCDPRGFDGPY